MPDQKKPLLSENRSGLQSLYSVREDDHTVWPESDNRCVAGAHEPRLRLGSVFGHGAIADRSHLSRPAGAPDADLTQLLALTIVHLGAEPGATHRTLRLFYEIGKTFGAGKRSLNEVGDALQDRSLNGRYPEGLACSKSSVRRAYEEAPIYFGRHFKMAEPAQLFYQGKGNAVYGLTELGKVALHLTREYLITAGAITEND